MFRISSFLLSVFSIFVYPAVIGTTVLYLYPLLFGCEFPPAHSPKPYCYPHSNDNDASGGSAKSTLAPFRLIAFGDPQLEGDTSLPDYTTSPLFPSFSYLRDLNTKAVWRYNRGVIEAFYQDLTKRDIPLLLWSYRKRLDLWGNDYYLAHQYRVLFWWLRPTHVTILGDLLGSQWISDEEFSSRNNRFWQRVFRHGTRVPDAIANDRGWTEELSKHPEEWARRIVNVPGNHDVGYAGDLTEDRLSRYERAFGRTNWDVTFTLSSQTSNITPSIHLISLNSMNLDGPVLSPTLQSQTYAYLNDLIARSHSQNNTLTLLLTHIPLPKPRSVCADAEYFNYYTDEDVGGVGGGALREQNHLSRTAAQPLLEGLFGLTPNPLQHSSPTSRKGLILTGHDHEGCDVYHFANLSAPRDGSEWSAVPYNSPAARTLRENADVPGVREVTLRSMMGEFGGRAGLVSAWFDEAESQWRVEVGKCDLGVQHWWWGVHALDLIVLLLGVFGMLARVFEAVGDWRAEKRRTRERERRMKLEKRRRSKSRSKSTSVAGTPRGGTRGKERADGYFGTSASTRSVGGVGESVRKRRIKEEL